MFYYLFPLQSYAFKSKYVYIMRYKRVPWVLLYRCALCWQRFITRSQLPPQMSDMSVSE